MSDQSAWRTQSRLNRPVGWSTVNVHTTDRMAEQHSDVYQLAARWSSPTLGALMARFAEKLKSVFATADAMAAPKPSAEKPISVQDAMKTPAKSGMSDKYVNKENFMPSPNRHNRQVHSGIDDFTVLRKDTGM
eukprot:255329_1